MLASILSLRYVLHPSWYDVAFAEKYWSMLPIVLLHGIGACTALGLGPWQFLPQLRARFSGVHRMLGRVYFTAVLMAGATGFWLGTRSNGGVFAHLGFCAQATLWLYSALASWRAVVRGDIRTHQQWITRNFALTFSAVISRMLLNAFTRHHFVFAVIYPYVAWLSWVPLLLLVECCSRPPSISPLRAELPSPPTPSGT